MWQQVRFTLTSFKVLTKLRIGAAAAGPKEIRLPPRSRQKKIIPKILFSAAAFTRLSGTR
jgi:hypothetical protein